MSFDAHPQSFPPQPREFRSMTTMDTLQRTLCTKVRWIGVVRVPVVCWALPTVDIRSASSGGLSADSVVLRCPFCVFAVAASELGEFFDAQGSASVSSPTRMRVGLTSAMMRVDTPSFPQRPVSRAVTAAKRADR
jgi:hypothetical protein